MTIDRKRLGAAIRELRERRSMTQVELSRAAGLSETGNSIAMVERGERGLSIEAMNQVAEALQVPAGCLAILGSSAKSGHPRSKGLLKALQDLVHVTLDAQDALEPVTARSKASRTRTRRAAAGV